MLGLAAESTFTNKVDVWALGCIMGEILTGNKIFGGDWAVDRYYTSKSELTLTLPETVPVMLQRHVNQLLRELLQRDYLKRPRIIALLPMFNSYLLLARHSVSKTSSLLSLLAEYQQWKELVCECRTQQQLVAHLFQHFQSALNYKAAIAFGIRLILDEPQNSEYWVQLEDAYKKNGDDSYAVNGWRSIVEFQPTFAAAHVRLTAACLRSGGHSLACHHWRQLYEREPKCCGQMGRSRDKAPEVRRLGGSSWGFQRACS
jgi:tetratricopeptide (TPR) repeat protein